MMTDYAVCRTAGICSNQPPSFTNDNATICGEIMYKNLVGSKQWNERNNQSSGKRKDGTTTNQTMQQSTEMKDETTTTMQQSTNKPYKNHATAVETVTVSQIQPTTIIKYIALTRARTKKTKLNN